MKAYVKKWPHWDEQDTRELAQDGWEKLSQQTINNWSDSMPGRLKQVIDMEGKMTGN
jgi:hypothetical protein